MNLQEILSYRDACIHCQRPLTMRIKKYPKLSIKANDGGLNIWSGHKNGIRLVFGFDGQYKRNKREYKIYSAPVYIQKLCMFHPRVEETKPVPYKPTTPGPILLKSRSIGMTTMTSAMIAYNSTLNSLRNLTCQYDFMIYGDSEGNYEANMQSEYLYHHNDEEFWHVNTHFSAGISDVYQASYTDTLDDVMQSTLRLPAMNLKNVQNAEQLINKIKLYTLFS